MGDNIRQLWLLLDCWIVSCTSYRIHFELHLDFAERASSFPVQFTLSSQGECVGVKTRMWMCIVVQSKSVFVHGHKLNIEVFSRTGASKSLGQPFIQAPDELVVAPVFSATRTEATETVDQHL